MNRQADKNLALHANTQRHPAGKKLGAAFIGLLLLGGAGTTRAAIDLSVNHNAIPPSATGLAGGSYTYAPLVFLNADPDGTGASGVVLTQVLPEGVSLQSIAFTPVGGNSCSTPAMPFVVTGSNKTITCNLDDIAGTGSGQGITVKFNVIIPTVDTNWTAVASAHAAQNDTDASNNLALPRNITTTKAADLGIVLAGPGGTPRQNVPFDYTATVTNHGPSAIPADGAVVVTFAVPANMTASGAGGSNGWTCSPTGGGGGTILSCSHAGPLAGGASVDGLSIPVISSVSGEITASANVKGKDSGGGNDFPDAVDANNTDSVTLALEVDNVVDVTLSKTASPVTVDKARTDNAVTFTLTPSRLSGAAVPASVTVTDSLPPGVSLNGAPSGTNWNCGATAGNDISCTYTGTAPAVGGAYPAIGFATTVDGTSFGAATSFANTAHVAAANESPEATGNNSATRTIVLSNTVNPTLDKTPSKSPIMAGENFYWRIRVSNPSGGLDILPGQTITVTDVVPAGTTVQSAMGSSAGWNCTPLPAAAGTTITCTNAGGLAAGSSSDIRLNSTLTHSGGGTFVAVSNTATLTGVAGRDSTPRSDSSSVNVSAHQADLGVVKSVGGMPVATGSEVSYTLTVTNHDAVNPSTGVRVTDQLNHLVIAADGCTLDSAGACTIPRWPAGGFVDATIISGGAPGDGCSAAGAATSRTRTVTCDIATLAPGATAVIQIKAIHYAEDGAANRTFDNTANVASTQVEDPDSTNDSSTAAVEISPVADLQVFKEPLPSPAAVGEPVVYTLHVWNAGPSAAANVKLEDVLPANALWIDGSLVSGSAGCTDKGTGVAIADDAAGRTLACSWAAQLAANAQFTVKYALRSDPHETAAGDRLDNAVAVATMTAELRTDNNADAATVDLTPAELDVLVNMEHGDDGLLLGEATEYTITVTNNGPSYATQVRMTDVFPSDLILGSQVFPSTAVFSYQGGLPVTSSRAGSPYGAGNCTAPLVGAVSGPLVCEFSKLAPGETLAIKFTLRAESLAAGRVTGTIYHNATVELFETEWLSDDSDTAVNNFTSDRTSARTADAPALPDPDGPKSSIAGYVYHDANNNGVFEGGEDPIAGVTLTLHGTDGSTVTTTTNVGGYYQFTGLTPGVTYVVAETQPAAWLDGKDTAGNVFVHETPGSNDEFVVTVGEDQHGANWNFGEFKGNDPTAAICGVVYVDPNRNGILDDAEGNRIGGVTVVLTGTDDLGPIAPRTVTTGEDGRYCFTGLRPGTYTITENNPPDYQGTGARAGTAGGNGTAEHGSSTQAIRDIALGAGDALDNYNFGHAKAAASIPVDNPLALIMLGLGVLGLAARQYRRK